MMNDLTKSCDYLWRRAVLLRDGPLFPVCGKEPAYEAHHLIGRRDWHSRWDIRNGLAVCRQCHENPAAILLWLKANRPKQYAWVMRNRYKVESNRTIDLNRVYRKLAKVAA